MIAFSRRRGAEPERIEIWTLRDGKAVHYRGYPLDDGLAVLSATTRSRKLEVVCRAVLAFNRGDRAGWAGYFEGEGREFAERLSGQRLDDVKVLGETFEALVVSATYHHGEAATRRSTSSSRSAATRRAASSSGPRPRRRSRRRPAAPRPASVRDGT